MLKLDKFDLKILSVIQREGRVTKVALAELIGLSASPCWTRLRRLEKAGIVSSYHARLELRGLVPFSTVFMEVTLKSHTSAGFLRFERHVSDIPEIVACFAIGGGIDYMLKVVTRDIDAYQRLVDLLLDSDLGIDRYFSYIVTRQVKDDLHLPLDSLMAGAVR